MFLDYVFRFFSEVSNLQIKFHCVSGFTVDYFKCDKLITILVHFAIYSVTMVGLYNLKAVSAV